MNSFNGLKEFCKRVFRKLKITWVITTVFLFFTFVVGDSNVVNHLQYDETIRNLSRDIEMFEKEIEENRIKIEKLRMDKDGLERFAREEYQMRKANEDIYIIK